MSEPKSFQVTLTEAQGTGLLQLLNVAVQAQGLTVAANALVLAGILQEAFKASQAVVKPASEVPDDIIAAQKEALRIP